MIDLDTISRVASSVREQLAPSLSPLAAVPLHGLRRDVRIVGLHEPWLTRARSTEILAHNVWAITTFDRERAWIWLNQEAWPEVVTGTTRTRFTLAHELGHVALHSEELDELDVQADPEHDARLEAEANAFAARLLIPDQAVRRLSKLRADELGRRFGVSTMAAARRIDEVTT